MKKDRRALVILLLHNLADTRQDEIETQLSQPFGEC